MVMPMKRTLFGWKVDKYDATKHEDYAQDLLEAPITAVLGSVVFFYQVYKGWIKSSKDYLIQEMMTKNLTRYQAEVLYQTLCDSMDGFIRPNLSLTTKKSNLKRLMSYLRSNILMTSPISKRRENLNRNK